MNFKMPPQKKHHSLEGSWVCMFKGLGFRVWGSVLDVGSGVGVWDLGSHPVNGRAKFPRPAVLVRARA